MIMDNIPQSILYPAYCRDVGASEQIRRIKAYEERWRRMFEGYDVEIERFDAAIADVALCNEGFLDKLERNYLDRIFGSVTKLFGEVDSEVIYNTMMELYAGRYDLDNLFGRLAALFGIRLRVADECEVEYCKMAGENVRGEIIELLKMLLPADIYVKVSYVGRCGLGAGFKLGESVLERGYFVL